MKQYLQLIQGGKTTATPRRRYEGFFKMVCHLKVVRPQECFADTAYEAMNRMALQIETDSSLPHDSWGFIIHPVSPPAIEFKLEFPENLDDYLIEKDKGES